MMPNWTTLRSGVLPLGEGLLWRRSELGITSVEIFFIIKEDDVGMPRRMFSVVLLVCLLLSAMLPVVYAEEPDNQDDEARAEAYFSKLDAETLAAEQEDPPKEGKGTTLADMLARAEAIVNYTWIPSENIKTWNGSKYNDLNYFPAGKPVKGMPYTLFAWEFGKLTLCSLETYKGLASSNYSATMHCSSVGAVRTGPVYGSCCADFVCEVFGGGFMRGKYHNYHSVSGIRDSEYSETIKDVPISELRPGDAISDTQGKHIMWIGEVTDTHITFYEQTPPVAVKVTVSKTSPKNNEGGFLKHKGLLYTIVTRSKDFVETPVDPPKNAWIEASASKVAIGEKITFTYGCEGQVKGYAIGIDKIGESRFDTLYPEKEESCSTTMNKAGEFSVYVTAWNDVGSVDSKRITIRVYDSAPTKSVIRADKKYYNSKEKVEFSFDSDTALTYAIGVDLRDKDGNKVKRVNTYYCGTCTEYSVCDLDDGLYSAYITASNQYGGLDSQKIFFCMGHEAKYSLGITPTKTYEGRLVGVCVNGPAVDPVVLPKLNTTDYTKTTTKPATCTTGGVDNYRWNTTTYGNFSFNVNTEARGHSYTALVTAPTCTEQGYTTHTCSRCADSYQDGYTAATGHDHRYLNQGETHAIVCDKCSHKITEGHTYMDNVCICGALEVMPDSSIIINHSLNLARDIAIKYAVKDSMLSAYDSFYMEVRVPVYNGNDLKSYRSVTLAPVLNGGYYFFTMGELTAVNMNDILIATLHMNRGGQKYVTLPDRYSVATYAINMMNREGMDEELKTLCADLLRYGATAQMFKQYRTDAPATAAMTAENRAYLSDLDDVTFGNNNILCNDLPQPTITWVGKLLNLGSKVVVKLVINAGNYAGDVSKLTMRISYQSDNGIPRTVTLANPTVYNEAGRMYAFEFDGLTAAELRTVLSAAVYDGDTRLSQTLRYSADTYGNNQKGELLTLCKALFAYSDSAKVYFNK